jgi:hypothetical protein
LGGINLKQQGLLTEMCRLATVTISLGLFGNRATPHCGGGETASALEALGGRPDKSRKGRSLKGPRESRVAPRRCWRPGWHLQTVTGKPTGHPPTFRMNSPNATASGSGTPSSSHLRMARDRSSTCQGWGIQACLCVPQTGEKKGNTKTSAVSCAFHKESSHLSWVPEPVDRAQVLEGGNVVERLAQASEGPADVPQAQHAGADAACEAGEHDVQDTLRTKGERGRPLVEQA